MIWILLCRKAKYSCYIKIFFKYKEIGICDHTHTYTHITSRGIYTKT